MSALIPIRKLHPADRPSFYDVNPEFVGGSSGNGRQSADQKMLHRLEAVDAVLAETIVEGFDNCTK
jgi:hypothetical protein